MARYGMVVDLKRCVGCHACTMACRAENGTPVGMWWAKVHVREVGQYPTTGLVFMPLLCMHCENAPCEEVCPTGATHTRPDGIVAVDYDKCMGCGYCRIVCPYDARTIVEEVAGYYPDHGLTAYEDARHSQHQAGVAEKCNFCMDRVAQGQEPACVQVCPAYARHFGDLSDPNSEVSKMIAQKHGFQLLPELGTNPSVYYLPA
jgi:phenylacetyl-CoA:acceptor oxidoreductase subunit 1